MDDGAFVTLSAASTRPGVFGYRYDPSEVGSILGDVTGGQRWGSNGTHWAQWSWEPDSGA